MKALAGNMVFVFILAAMAGLATAWGQLPPGSGTKDGVWRDAWGTAETQPFRLVDGRSSPESSVEALSRADWVVEQEGRTYLLYETDPENRDSNEGLWIGLLGDNGEILRKILLARNVRDISGVQGNGSGASVSRGWNARNRWWNRAARFLRPVLPDTCRYPLFWQRDDWEAASGKVFPGWRPGNTVRCLRDHKEAQ